MSQALDLAKLAISWPTPAEPIVGRPVVNLTNGDILCILAIEDETTVRVGQIYGNEKYSANLADLRKRPF